MGFPPPLHGYRLTRTARGGRGAWTTGSVEGRISTDRGWHSIHETRCRWVSGACGRGCRPRGQPSGDRSDRHGSGALGVCRQGWAGTRNTNARNRGGFDREEGAGRMVTNFHGTWDCCSVRWWGPSASSVGGSQVSWPGVSPGRIRAEGLPCRRRCATLGMSIRSGRAQPSAPA